MDGSWSLLQVCAKKALICTLEWEQRITTCLHLTMKSWKWPLGCHGLSKKGTSSARTWCRDTACFSRFSLQWLSNRPVRVVMLKHRMIRMLIERSLNHMRTILVQHRTTTTWFTTMPEGNSSPKQPVQLLTSEHRAPILSKQSQRSSPNYISRHKQDINRTSPEYPTEYHSKPTNDIIKPDNFFRSPWPSSLIVPK